MLIRINDLYRPQMNASEVYDTTRTAWPLGQRRERAKSARNLKHAPPVHLPVNAVLFRIGLAFRRATGP